MIAQSNGTTIRYEVSGPASAPAVVFSHSLGVSLEMWQPQVELFAKHYRVIRYDTRGHGGSAVETGLYSIELLGKDVLGLLDFLAIDQVHFCGLSMGGVIGQWLGIHASQRLRSLTLANTAAKIGTTESWNARIVTVEKEGLGTVIPGTLERWFTTAFRERHPEIVCNVEALLRKTETAGYLGCCSAIRDADFRSASSQISVPTLLIAGKEDPVTSSNDMHFLESVIPQATYVELDAAHLSSVENPNGFNAALQGFLA